jgi:hypothetical protein
MKDVGFRNGFVDYSFSFVAFAIAAELGSLNDLLGS